MGRKLIQMCFIGVACAPVASLAASAAQRIALRDAALPHRCAPPAPLA